MKKLTNILRTAALLLTASVLLLTHLASVAGEPEPSEVRRKYRELGKSGPILTEKHFQGVKLEIAVPKGAETVPYRVIARNGQPAVPNPGQINPAIIWMNGQTNPHKKEPVLMDDPSPIRRQLQAIPAEVNRGPLGEKFSLPRR